MLPMIKRWPLNADTVNAEDDWGRTPLHYAVASTVDSEEVMELLLKNGAKPDVKGKTGNTPLAEAVAQGSMKKAELLLRFKADVNAHEGAALYAAMGTKNFPMLKFLKKQGADLNIKPRFWLAPLIWAVSAPHYIDSRPSDAERAKSDEYYLPVVKWLLENGADKNVKDDRDRSALQVATSSRHPKIAQLLREHGLRD